ncbi:unnamed protein product, partial [Urochloa humidicola]
KVLNVTQVTELRAYSCPNLRHVERVDRLQQLFLHKDMIKVSSLWVPRLQEQCQLLQGVLYFEDGPVDFCYNMLYKDWGYTTIKMRLLVWLRRLDISIFMSE